MDAATFFALFWGWLTVVFATILFIRPNVLVDLKRLMVEVRAFALIYGLLSLLLGLASVILHNIWVLNWHVLITIFGWLTLLKGVTVIGWPEISKNTSFEVRIKSTRIALVVVGVLAVWMLVATYAGAN
ncbi:hypothetical protein [Micromonospora sp. NPDC000668]|uniref:hypothetical protein n=1 Tax=Micromonospora sp. NPDC000668 TaxID=3364219 RepID=UPI0036A6FB81